MLQLPSKRWGVLQLLSTATEAVLVMVTERSHRATQVEALGSCSKKGPAAVTGVATFSSRPAAPSAQVLPLPFIMGRPVRSRLRVGWDQGCALRSPPVSMGLGLGPEPGLAAATGRSCPSPTEYLGVAGHVPQAGWCLDQAGQKESPEARLGSRAIFCPPDLGPHVTF